MKKARKSTPTPPDDGMRAHYDFRGGVRGKYASAFADGTNVVRLDDDVAEAFRMSDSVNAALRALAQLVKARASKVPV